MDSKIKEQLEAYCRERYQKIVDALTEFSMDLFSDLYSNLPEIMSDEDKIKFIEELIETQANGLVGSAKSFNTKDMQADMVNKSFNTKDMQADMVNKLKEQANG